jgi:glutathione S-transferase
MSTMETTLTLHAHPLSSYCWKVLVPLYENGTPFRLELIEGPPKTHAAFTRMWPIGKMPVLEDRGRGQVLAETSIIIEYLQQHYPGAVTLLPTSAPAQLEARLWDRFFDLYVHTPMQKLVSDRMRPEDQKDPAGAADARATLDIAYAMLEQRAAIRTWATGDEFSIADCSAIPALFYAKAVHPISESLCQLASYFNRLMERPAVRRTVREAQPYFQYFPFHDALETRFTSPGIT